MSRVSELQPPYIPTPPANGPAYRCPNCGAWMDSLSAPCPRCGLVFDEAGRKRQLNQILDTASPLDRQAGLPPVTPAAVPLTAANPLTPRVSTGAPVAGMAPTGGGPIGGEAAAATVPGKEAPATAKRGLSRKQILVLSLSCLAGLIILILAAGTIRTAIGGYNSSPDKLAQGLLKSIRDQDIELLLTLTDESGRKYLEAYTDITSSSPNSSWSTTTSAPFPYEFTLQDILKGERDGFAIIVIHMQNTAPTTMSDIYGSDPYGYYSTPNIMLMASKKDGKWYLDASTLSSMLYVVNRS